MVIQWDEPETPNGQVTVGTFSEILSHRAFSRSFFANDVANERAICPFAGIQSVLHNGLEPAHGIVAVSNGG